MLVGFRNRKLRDVAVHATVAKKSLSRESARLLPIRISQLAALECCEQIECLSDVAPLEDWEHDGSQASCFAVSLSGKDKIAFVPVGNFSQHENGKPNLSTVTHIEIVCIGK